MMAATDAGHFPAPALPEVAFLGRSNVGKSSVINSLVGDKAGENQFHSGADPQHQLLRVALGGETAAGNDFH